MELMFIFVGFFGIRNGMGSKLGERKRETPEQVVRVGREEANSVNVEEPAEKRCRKWGDCVTAGRKRLGHGR